MEVEVEKASQICFESFCSELQKNNRKLIHENFLSDVSVSFLQVVSRRRWKVTNLSLSLNSGLKFYTFRILIKFHS